MLKKIDNLPIIKNTFNVAKSKFGVTPDRDSNGNIRTGWYTAQSMNSHYYQDSSKEHASWINNFDSSKYTSVHILGNSPCLNKVPASILNDKSNFIIGLNRSFIKGRSDVLLWRDNCTIKDIAAKSDEEPYKSRILNARLTKVGMGTPERKGSTWRNPETGARVKSLELKECTSINRMNKKFFPAMTKYCEDIRLGNPIDKVINLDDPEQYQFNADYKSGECKPMIMHLSVAHAAMHLVTQLFKDNKVPLYLHGVSYDVRTYFYWAHESLNQGIKKNTLAKQFKSTNESYGMGRDSDFEKLKKNLDTFKKDHKMEHREVCYYMLRYLFLHGYQVYYSAESMLLDWMASRFDNLKKVSYD